jgi:NTE family protein
VLSGGGSLGAYEIGVIDALVRRNVVPDLIVGTSAGAINGAYWAIHQGGDVAGTLLDSWRSVRSEELLPGGRLAALRSLIANRNNLYGSRGLARLVARHAPADARLEDLPIPTAITVTDAITGERVVLRQGPLRAAVLASAAIPGVFPPIDVDGRLCIDGGVAANCDLEAVVEAGIDQAIAVVLSDYRPDGPPLNMGEVLARSVLFSLRRQTELTLHAVTGQLQVALLQPTLVRTPPLGDFSKSQELFELGKTMTEELCDQLLDADGNVLAGVVDGIREVPGAAGEPEPPPLPVRRRWARSDRPERPDSGSAPSSAA